jgi:hypothetical protein
MNGAGIGNLTLYREDADGSRKQLFIKSGRQTASWKKVSVTLPVGFYKVRIFYPNLKVIKLVDHYYALLDIF